VRKLALLLLLVQAAAAAPVSAEKPVTIQQLARLLADSRGKPDAKVAQMLSTVVLIERLDLDKLPPLETDLPGVESRRSLVLLADVSAFLPPPQAEIPATALPDLVTQREIMARVVSYAAKTIHQLPNFIATRDTIRFEDSPAEQNIFGSALPYKPLHAAQDYSSTAYYRDGNEVEDSGLSAGKRTQSPTRGLITSGEFGPIISTVLLDAAQGQLTWSHWEVGKLGPLAVFRYRVPKESSHYHLKFCCVAGEDGNGVVEQFTGYHGEIAADPSTGAIFRLTLRAEPAGSDKIVRADILVQYGPVDIGGRTYICPIKSISLSVAPLSATTYVRDANRFAPSTLDQGQNRTRQTLLNDVDFINYHVFRSDTRVVTGDSASTSGSLATSTADHSTPDQSISAASPAEEPTQSGTPVDSAPVAAAPGLSNHPNDSQPAPESSKPDSVVPEISEGNVIDSSGVLGTHPSASGDGYRLQVTTRLVDVGIVALDKKGQPVTGFKAEDFEIYDNGRKQDTRFFNSPAEFKQSSPEEQPVASSPSPVYSNRRADIDSANAGPGPSEHSVMILLIDSNSLAWKDLAYARQQMLRFLQAMPANERVGIYIRHARGFEVLVEATSDSVKLGSALRAWMPTARDLAGAQLAEQRNRQQIDDVGHVEDLQSVNGNINASPDSSATADPQLRDFGSDSGARALATLVLIARHLAATPGRKSLVWVASDNVLANWSGEAVSTDKGSTHLQGPFLRAQEALNDSNVSIYPLDASQLETQAVDAGLEDHNVVLSAGVTAPPGPQSGGAAPGRVTAEMQQDVHPVQDSIRAMAMATGGRVFRRGGDLAASLASVLQDGRASYLVGFVPDTPADDLYHVLTVKLISRHRGVQLRYRAGYLYSKEPVTLKDRFRRAVWQPFDANDIAIYAHPLPAMGGSAFKLNIAVNDLALELKGGRWNGKVDIFAVKRSEDGRQAQISERQLILSLLPETYQDVMKTGIPFDQFVDKNTDVASIRIIVVDESSGRMGSVTLPADIMNGK